MNTSEPESGSGLLKPDDPGFDLKYVEKVVRVWTDPEYRKSLPPEELKRLPASPAGPLVDLIKDSTESEVQAYSAGRLASPTDPQLIPTWTIIIATMLLTCGFCHTAPQTCGHGGCVGTPQR